MAIRQLTMLYQGTEVTADVTASTNPAIPDLILTHNGRVIGVIRDGEVQQFAPGYRVQKAGALVATASVGVTEPA
jgi:hypothetical protein